MMARVHDISSGETCHGCLDKLKWVHPILAQWFLQKKKKYMNLHVAEGWRGPSDQAADYDAKKSDLQWPNSKHNKTKPDGSPQSEAVDIFQINEDGEATWSRQFYMQIYSEVQANREPIRWGGTFKLRSGSRDYPHFELIRVEAKA